MPHHVLILGAGMVGSTMALDLARDDRGARIRLADRDPKALERAAARIEKLTGTGIETCQTDLAEPGNVMRLAETADLVLGALSSHIGFQTLQAVIEAGTACVDISFMPENALELNALAIERGVTAIFDCGVAPGLSNMLGGLAAGVLDPCEAIEIYVGGVPRHPEPPFYYKAAFSPADVLEEYTRPARFVEHGNTVVREALSEPEIITFEEVGDLEAFNTDGLRSMIDTMPTVPSMKEKTLRYPGHIDRMRELRDIGLMSTEPVELDGQYVVPRDLLSRLLFPKWAYAEGEADITVMRVIARGEMNGEARCIGWSLYDEYDPVDGCSSMSRTTAFPATLVARMVLNGEIGQPGVLAPEQLAAIPGVVERVLDGMRARGVRISDSV